MLFCSSAFAQQVRVGVLRDYDVQRILFSYNDGSYLILADSLEFGAILPNEFVDISFLSNDKVQLKRGVELLGEFDKISLIETLPSSSITLTSKSPTVKERKYQDDFEITGGAKGLTIVNLADMVNYLSGVVESEGGGGKEPEYYKVQAIMCRTYVLKNLTRHKEEGFAVCDRTHCQAYHSMLRFTPKIREAVVETDDFVLLDDQNDLAGTYFHANCGGQTSEASYVWNSNLPYLKTFKDTFAFTPNRLPGKNVFRSKNGRISSSTNTITRFTTAFMAPCCLLSTRPTVWHFTTVRRWESPCVISARNSS